MFMTVMTVVSSETSLIWSGQVKNFLPCPTKTLYLITAGNIFYTHPNYELGDTCILVLAQPFLTQHLVNVTTQEMLQRIS